LILFKWHRIRQFSESNQVPVLYTPYSMIHSILKDRTASLHLQLEEKLDLFAQVNQLSQYRELLEKFYLFYKPLEEELARYGDWLLFDLDFEPRRKTEFLRRDLIALGSGEEILSGIGSAPASALPQISSFERAVGCLYVLEGSTLGGQLISRHFGHKLGLNPDTGLGFYSAYQGQTGSMWRAFCTFLEELTSPGASIPETDAEEIILGACDTFTKLEYWLCRSPDSAQKA
jgi:heme oxygenase